MAGPRLKMRLALSPQQSSKVWSFRQVTPGDRDKLGALMLEAYRGTVDYEGETLEQSIEEAQSILDGKHGVFLPAASFVIEQEEQPNSAVLVMWYGGVRAPLVAVLMTLPDCAGMGMGAFLLQKAINALIDQGYEELYLFVTEANTPAVHLYKKLGFQLAE